MKEKVSISLKVDGGLKRDLAALAAKEDRSLSRTAARILREGVRHRMEARGGTARAVGV
jgi:predicted transcriptional regulator